LLVISTVFLCVVIMIDRKLGPEGP